MPSRLERRYARFTDERLLSRAKRIDRMAAREKVVLLEELSARRLSPLPEKAEAETQEKLPPLQKENTSAKPSRHPAIAEGPAAKFAKHYAQQNNLVLQQLASKADKLVPPARKALRAELKSRKQDINLHFRNRKDRLADNDPIANKAQRQSFPGAIKIFREKEDFEVLGYPLLLIGLAGFLYFLLAGNLLILFFLFLFLLGWRTTRNSQQIRIVVYRDYLLYVPVGQAPEKFTKIRFEEIKEIHLKNKPKTSLLLQLRKGGKVIIPYIAGEEELRKTIDYLRSRIQS